MVSVRRRTLLWSLLPVAVLAMLAAPSFARTATFPKATVGCPTEEGMIAAYEIAAQRPPDVSAMQAAFDHYDCQWIPKESTLTIVSHGPVTSVVALHRVFSKDLWLYVPTFSFTQ